MFGISAAVLLERDITFISSFIHSLPFRFSALIFISVLYFNNGVFIYVSSSACRILSPLERVVRLVRICQARTSFNEMQFHHLNESYDSYEFGRLGPPLMRYSFTKSNVMLFSLKVSHSPLGSYES